MDNKKEIESLKEDLRLCDINHQAITKRILKLQSQLEAEKPELRHWDYGKYSGGSSTPLILIEHKGEVRYCDDGSVHGFCPLQSVRDNSFIKLGNLLTDLKAMSEDLEEFEMEDLNLKVSFGKEGDWQLEQGGDIILIRPDKIHDFILKLRRMEATAIRAEKKVSPEDVREKE